MVIVSPVRGLRPWRACSESDGAAAHRCEEPAAMAPDVSTVYSYKLEGNTLTLIGQRDLPVRLQLRLLLS